MSLILILEDSRAMAEAASRVLRAAGHETVCCFEVTEAISACQERRPDLALTEYWLAEGTGLAFLKKLEKLPAAPPVLMAAGAGREEVAARAMRLGAWAYLVKDETYLETLAERVGQALAEWGEGQARREKERLRRRLEAQNELAGWLAHNFKNILSASIGYLNLVDLESDRPERARQTEYLAESRRSQECAIRLLEQLIRLTETEEGEAELVNAGEVVDEAWETAKAKVLFDAAARSPEALAETQAQVAGVAFINFTRRLPPLPLARADLVSIMEALLQNALEAVLTARDPRVLVLSEVAGPRRQVELTVKDNGRGMSERVLKHALEPLFSTKGEVGVGLSLSLASSLVLRWGGDLSLASAPGAGSTAKVVLPL